MARKGHFQTVRLNREQLTFGWHHSDMVRKVQRLEGDTHSTMGQTIPRSGQGLPQLIRKFFHKFSLTLKLKQHGSSMAIVSFKTSKWKVC